MSSVAESVWEAETAGARLTRALLTPASWLFGQVVARRNARFDRGGARPAALPAISIGNLTVGGTGKTPIAAWCVQQLRARGARPAIVMRGVGDDEWRVHGLLNPGTSVIVSPDRTNGMVTARARGADCAVLDDAFQHRQASRVVDIALLSADRWTGDCRLLPAGPFREPLTAVRRAHVVVITVKAASTRRVDDVLAAVRDVAPSASCAVVRLVPGSLRLALSVVGARSASDSPRSREAQPRRDLLTHPASWVHGQALTVVSALGDPASFEAQLRGLGAELRVVRRYPDHRAFSAADAASIARDAAGTAGVVCTLKDAVKLAPVWPREAPILWYLTQSVVVDRGAEVLDRAFGRLLAARAPTTPTAG